jgi:hypothetical protein
MPSMAAEDLRRQYIETQTRRHLEGKGVELLDDGAVRDGEWAEGGQRAGEDKVKHLENVVRGLNSD